MSYSMTNNSDYPLQIDFTDRNGDRKKITLPPKKAGNNDHIRNFDPDETQEVKYTSLGKKPIYISFRSDHRSEGPENHIDGDAGHPDE